MVPGTQKEVAIGAHRFPIIAVTEQQKRIIAARTKLRERFLKKESSRPEKALGSGSLNRHGMPTLPPGQSKAKKWPVLDLGIHPKISRDQWVLKITGHCIHPQILDWKALMTFEQVEEESDFHCVTTWSKMDMRFGGIRLQDLIAFVGASENATHIMCYGSDGYCTNLNLSEALKTNVLLAYKVDGKELSREHGGPLRLITPELYAWKGAKWICQIEFMTEDRPGFWEKNGYSMTAKPWLEDRYSSNK